MTPAFSEEIIDIVASHDIGVFAGCPADAIERVAPGRAVCRRWKTSAMGLPVTILVIPSAMTISMMSIVAGRTEFGLASVTAGCFPRIGHDSDTTERRDLGGRQWVLHRGPVMDTRLDRLHSTL